MLEPKNPNAPGDGTEGARLDPQAQQTAQGKTTDQDGQEETTSSGDGDLDR